MFRKYIKGALAKSFLHYNFSRSCKQVALTFDDGPTEWTPEILDCLIEYNARATFFVVGRKADLLPDVLQKIVNNKSELANHSWSHPYISQLPFKEIGAEFARLDSLLANYQPSSPIIRPPYGELSVRFIMYLLLQRRHMALWSRCIGGDAKVSIKSHIDIQKDLKNNPIRGGDIILLHDTNKGTSDAMPALLEHINKLGLLPVTLSELFNK